MYSRAAGGEGTVRMTALTESLVDAKDGTVKAQVETEIAKAVSDLQRAMYQTAFWVAGTVVAAFGIAVSILLSQLS